MLTADTVITFNNQSFTLNDLNEMSITECLALHNRIRAVRESGPERAGFRDKREAVEKTWGALSEIYESLHTEVEEDNTSKPKIHNTSKPKIHNTSKPNGRKRFQFPRNEEPLKTCREGSLRDRVIKCLKSGGKTYNDVLEVVKQFDIDRGKEPHNDEQRAYEIIRILHFQMNYGMDFDDETGAITLVE